MCVCVCLCVLVCVHACARTHTSPVPDMSAANGTQVCALKNATFREIVAAQSYTRNVFNVREGRWREVLCANSAACKVYMHIRNYLYICKYANVAFVNMQMHMFVCICTCMNIYVYMQEGWSRYTCTHMHTQMVWHNTNELLKEGYCKTYKHTIAYTCIEVCTLTCLHADGVAQHQRAPQGGLLRDQDGRHPCHRVCLPSEFR